MKTVEEWKTVLRAELKNAMRSRQLAHVSVLRETLAAIDNAEAADLSTAPAVEHGVIAGGIAGRGTGEVARKSLSPAEVRAILERELSERRQAEATYTKFGQHEQAEALRLQISLLTSFVD